MKAARRGSPARSRACYRRYAPPAPLRSKPPRAKPPRAPYPSVRVLVRRTGATRTQQGATSRAATIAQPVGCTSPRAFEGMQEALSGRSLGGASRSRGRTRRGGVPRVRLVLKVLLGGVPAGRAAAARCNRRVQVAARWRQHSRGFAFVTYVEPSAAARAAAASNGIEVRRCAFPQPTSGACAACCVVGARSGQQSPRFLNHAFIAGLRAAGRRAVSSARATRTRGGDGGVRVPSCPAPLSHVGTDGATAGRGVADALACCHAMADSAPQAPIMPPPPADCVELLGGGLNARTLPYGTRSPRANPLAPFPAALYAAGIAPPFAHFSASPPHPQPPRRALPPGGRAHSLASTHASPHASPHAHLAVATREGVRRCPRVRGEHAPSQRRGASRLSGGGHGAHGQALRMRARMRPAMDAAPAVLHSTSLVPRIKPCPIRAPMGGPGAARAIRREVRTSSSLN